MPKTSDLPEGTRAYVYHGVELDGVQGDNATGACPWCGRENKFSVKMQTGIGQCFVCQEKLNLIEFLRRLWERCEETGSDSEYEEMAEERGLRDVDTLRRWGLRKNMLTGEWIVPGWSSDGRLLQLYKLVTIEGKGRWLPTPNGAGINGHGLYAPIYEHTDKEGRIEWRSVLPLKPTVKEVHITEGLGDAMAWWEALRQHKRDDVTGIERTGNESLSMASTIGVVGIPGAGLFAEYWCSLCENRKTVMLFDNDHPRTPRGTNRVIQPGLDGMKRTAQILASASQPPSEIRYLKWGPGGYDPALPDGYDVRDYLRGAENVADNITCLMIQFSVVPGDWIPGRDPTDIRKGVPLLSAERCEDWKTLVNACRKGMKWIPGMDRTFSVMLATAAAVALAGRTQLWCRVIGPASSGKTTLCEGISVARKYVYPLDTISNVISGYQESKEGGENKGLVVKMRDKCLVIKDGDTLLRETNLNKILSHLRALFDRELRTHFGNRMSANHENVNSAVIICGTSNLRQLDTSEAGERLLTVRVMNDINEKEEDDINLRRLREMRDVMASPSAALNGKGSDPETMTHMKKLTGGYVNWLRENIGNLVQDVRVDEDVLHLINSHGKFVANMRCRLSKLQTEEVHRELSTRLVEQFFKLGYGLSVVRNRKEMDDDVLPIMQAVTVDSSYGTSLKIVSAMYNWSDSSGRGINSPSLSLLTQETEEDVRKWLNFLLKIKVVEKYEMSLGSHLKPATRWRLTESMSSLYRNVME